MTTAITEETTLRAIALEHPACIPAMERMGFDYCCGGDVPLRDAAAQKGIGARELIETLLDAAASKPAEAETDWRSATMTELADHIERTHHAFVRDALERLGHLSQRVANAHGAERPQLVELQRVIAAFTDDMHDHMVREERVVFPWLRRLERATEIHSGPPWSVRRPISCMIHDHDEAGEALRSMRRLTGDYRAPEGCCPTFREYYRLLEEVERDTHIHIHKENNILFPAGVAAEEKRYAPRHGATPVTRTDGGES